MESRYQNNATKITRDGRKVYRTKIYPNIPLRSDDVYVAVETGDRLDTLAFQYYNDQTLWWIIASANNIHTACFGLKDGTVIRIPRNYIQILTNIIK